jgi:glycosyltransferase involved in cell wall biosynthesis
VPSVLAAHPDARFWLGGDGEVQQVAALLAESSWGSSVRLLGWVEGEEKRAYLDRAAVFLLPSYAEGLPVAVLEAMAHGLAVITTPVGGIPEAIQPGETGVFVEPGDVSGITAACIELLKDEERRECLGSNARRLVGDQFEVQRVLAKLYQTYDELLNLPL